MSARVPAEDWTDDEWLVVLREVQPYSDISEGEALVARLRDETAGQGDSIGFVGLSEEAEEEWFDR